MNIPENIDVFLVDMIFVIILLVYLGFTDWRDRRIRSFLNRSKSTSLRRETMRIIDANALIANEDLHIIIGAGDNICIDIADIAKAPEIDPDSLRPKGQWENYPSHNNRRCSECKVEWDKPRFNVRANYCPNCGADMRGVL